MTDTMDTVTDLARGASRIGGPDQVLSDDAVRQFVTQSLAAEDLDGRSVCVIVPDGTRSCPLPLLLSRGARRAAPAARAGRPCSSRSAPTPR